MGGFRIGCGPGVRGSITARPGRFAPVEGVGATKPFARTGLRDHEFLECPGGFPILRRAARVLRDTRVWVCAPSPSQFVGLHTGSRTYSRSYPERRMTGTSYFDNQAQVFLLALRRIVWGGDL